MTISEKLYLAILALDSYNRDYEPQFAVNSDQIGVAVYDGTHRPPIGSQSAGFYATAYTWNGKTVISYRGTTFDGAAGPNSNPRQ